MPSIATNTVKRLRKLLRNFFPYRDRVVLSAEALLLTICSRVRAERASDSLLPRRRAGAMLIRPLRRSRCVFFWDLERRPPRRVAGSALPAFDNLHTTGHHAVLRFGSIVL